jgi:L-cysteine S-thiosulfotransferase
VIWKHALGLGMACAVAAASSATAQQASSPDAAAVAERYIGSSFTGVAPELRARLQQDEAQKLCTEYRNTPPKQVIDSIRTAAKASIEYPPDGKFLGDWKKGEEIAQSGYGLRFTDTDARRANGGNCYACHEVNKAEVSFGTLGPSLAGYGRVRNFREAEAKAAYEKIYNSHASFACSNMPRFGTNKVLTVDQIKDLVALLMDRESPVNK